MFENRDFPQALDETVFDSWLENGRLSKMGYHFMLVVWDDFEAAYQPVYVHTREEISKYKEEAIRERLIAAYDLYSESRII